MSNNRNRSRQQRAEATDSPTVVSYQGKTYRILPKDEWDVDVWEAIDDEKLTHLTRALLGPKQWAEFRATRPKISDFEELFDRISKAAGLDRVGGS